VILTKTRQTAGLTEWKSVPYDENSSFVASRWSFAARKIQPAANATDAVSAARARAANDQ
jgi:hypothetical protein